MIYSSLFASGGVAVDKRVVNDIKTRPKDRADLSEKDIRLIVCEIKQYG